MAITHGMNPEQVHSLAREMRTSATQIQDIISKLSGMLGSTSWEGQDRRTFQGDWDGTYVGQLRNVITALNEAAQKADTQATQQEQASAG